LSEAGENNNSADVRVFVLGDAITKDMCLIGGWIRGIN